MAAATITPTAPTGRALVSVERQAHVPCPNERCAALGGRVAVQVRMERGDVQYEVVDCAPTCSRECQLDRHEQDRALEAADRLADRLTERYHRAQRARS